MPAPLPLYKRILFPVLSIAIALIGLAIVGEIVFRILPTNRGLRAQAVDQKQPVFRFEPNRTTQWSHDWNFKLANRLRVNNAGFVNDQDYVTDHKTPLLAVIGDSYIEAAIVPYRETVHGRLQAAVGDKGRVYSFAASGAGLPQYLIWAKHARDTYKPDAVVINIIPNDFAESLHWREHSPGMWRWDKAADGSTVWRLTEYQPHLPRRIFRSSALAMYMMLNARVHTLLNPNAGALSFGSKDQRWVGNIAAITPEAEMADYRWAVDRFFQFLPEYSGVAPSRIVLAFDGFRPQMYAADPRELEFARTSTWATMRSLMMGKARAAGIGVIDLEQVFTEHYARERKRFEPPTDSHWNGVGHAALAAAVAGSITYKAIFSNDAPSGQQ